MSKGTHKAWLLWLCVLIAYLQLPPFPLIPAWQKSLQSGQPWAAGFLPVPFQGTNSICPAFGKIRDGNLCLFLLPLCMRIQEN